MPLIRFITDICTVSVGKISMKTSIVYLKILSELSGGLDLSSAPDNTMIKNHSTGNLGISGVIVYTGRILNDITLVPSIMFLGEIIMRKMAHNNLNISVLAALYSCGYCLMS